MTTESEVGLELEQYKWGFSKPENYVFKSRKGLSHEIVEEISEMKGEPLWMRAFRHKSLDLFLKRPMPQWGGNLNDIDFDDIYYYIKPTQEAGKTWDDLPAEIRETFNQLGIPEAEQKYLAGVGAQYECLSGDTRVYTARGLVPIREIEAGDTVFSFDEEANRIIPAKVRATAEKGEREVFAVRVGTRTIKATANHPFLALTYQKAEDRLRGRYTREWKYLQDLSVGDLVAVTKTLPETGVEYTLRQPEVKTRGADGIDFSYRYNAVTLPEYTTEDLMWWLGLYIGDGFIHYVAGADKARVEFAIPDSDPAVRVELARVTERLFGITPISNDPYRMTINSTIVARFLEANGFLGKALEKRVPSWVSSVPQTQKLAFLGGYLDSDGYVRDSEKNHDVLLTSGNRELLKDMTELLSLCGLPSSEIHRFESKHPADPDRMVVGYRVGVSGNYERIESRSPRRLERMNKREYHHDHSSAKGTYFQKHVTEFHGYVKIGSITPAGTEMVYDIEVEGPHNFVAEGLIVHNSEVIYHKVREDLEKLGVIFVDPGTALREHEELFRKYFSTIIPPNDNKFAALNSAVWSGGSFIYIPKGVRVEIPLQAYFRINAKNMGQFERTLIIADEDSYVHYVEGCTAPTYTSDSLHSAVVEIVVLKNARVRYTTIQNWSKNVYNLVTKRAVAYEGATMEWVDGNLGCLVEGSTVTTPEGIKTIESLEVGDKVLSYNEGAGQFCFRAVTAKRFSGHQPVHTVAVGERKLQVTANHPFYSYTHDPDRAKKLGRYQLGYVRADQLREAIVPCISLDYGTPHKLSIPSLMTEFASLNQYASDLMMSRSRMSRMAAVEDTTDDLMWLLGYWVGDGNIEVAPAKTAGVTRFAKVGFSTPTTDRARERLMGTMTALVDAPPTERADGHHLAWNSKELAEFFHLNGFEGKATTKRVPRWVWSLPESQRLAFIAGYLDADGCIARGRFSLKSANHGLLGDVASLLVTLGITSRLHTEFAGPRQVEIMGVSCVAHSSYRLVFAADLRLLDHVSATLRLQAQRDAPTVRQNRQVGRSSIALSDTVEIVDVDVSAPSAEPVPTWDIEVEGTGNFVSQGFIVHNSKLTMKYPAVWLMGEHARGEVLSVAFSGTGQHQDAGGKIVHVAPNTSSQIVSKSISKGSGRSSYRGLLKVQKGAYNVKSNVRCDALLLDEASRTDTYPYIEIEEEDVEIGHEATVSKVGEEQLFYLMSRGLSESEAYTMIVSGFIEPIVKELPLEYAVELNRLIQLEMSGSVG